jgi:uncharacterized membrane protein YecN with MAPEG domain
MHIAPYLAAFGLLTILHSIRVIRLRRQHKVGIGVGTGQYPELERLVRVHGNHTEYVPMGLLLLFALEYMDAPVLFLHLVGAPLLMGRILHAGALSRSHAGTPGRVVGMVLTFLSLFLGSMGVLIFTFFKIKP